MELSDPKIQKVLYFLNKCFPYILENKTFEKTFSIFGGNIPGSKKKQSPL